jgi:hypothetical protein
VALGDRLALRLSSTQSLWVYVFDDDGSGTAAVLFPLDAAHANPVAAGEERWLPGTGLSWQIDRAAAQEEFLVLASPQPLTAIETYAAELQRPQLPGVARGTMTLAAAPETGELHSAALRKLIVTARLQPGVREWHWQLPARGP